MEAAPLTHSNTNKEGATFSKSTFNRFNLLVSNTKIAFQNIFGDRWLNFFSDESFRKIASF